MLKLVTWNIRLGIQQGIERVISRLIEEDAHLIFLQEVGCNWVMGPKGDIPQRIATCLDASYVFVPTIDLTRPEDRHYLPKKLQAETGSYGHALFVRNPYTLLDSEILDLPQRIDEPRKLLVATLGYEERPIAKIFATHLSHLDDRPLQGRRLVEVMQEVGGNASLPRIVGGDLNQNHLFGRKPLWLEDLFLETETPINTTPTFPASAPIEAIDYLLTDARPGITTQALDVGQCSDHRLVRGSLRLRL